MGLLTLFKKMQ